MIVRVKFWLRKKIDIFKYIKVSYSAYHFTKKEFLIFPYLLIDIILKQIIMLNNRLKELIFDVRLGALSTGKNVVNESNAYIYGIAKHNKNATKIGYFNNIDFNKCIFYFFCSII